MINHPIAPVFNNNSKILILGSFPSQKSREEMFFYSHPQNRFWNVLSAVYNQNTPKTIDEKYNFLIFNQIAVWDVISSCDISKSADHSIKNVIINDLNIILSQADIKSIFVNGKTAEKYFNMYIKEAIGRSAIYLPSTSPANAAWSLEKLINKWKIITNM